MCLNYNINGDSSMSLDYEAIFTAYPECTGIVDDQAFKGDEDITSTL